MQIKYVESTISWSFKLPALILGFYFLLILPCKQVFFRMYPWLYKNTDILFIVIVALFILYKFNSIELGFSPKHLNQHIGLGLIIGLIMILSIPLLNYVIEVIGLSEHKLFSVQTQDKTTYNIISLTKAVGIVLVIPIIEQIFFTGFVLQSLLKKTNHIIGIYATSAIYTIFGFNITLGKFGLGICASVLFKLTGTLYASILFHISCLVGWELLANAYPKLMLLFGFLF